jgi:hypothetical protein
MKIWLASISNLLQLEIDCFYKFISDRYHLISYTKTCNRTNTIKHCLHLTIGSHIIVLCVCTNTCLWMRRYFIFTLLLISMTCVCLYFTINNYCLRVRWAFRFVNIKRVVFPCRCCLIAQFKCVEVQVTLNVWFSTYPSRLSIWCFFRLKTIIEGYMKSK